MAQADGTPQPAADLGRWGAQLYSPHDLHKPGTLDIIENAFDASAEFVAGQTSEIAAQQARIPANFTPPEGHVFVYGIEDGSDIRYTSLQNHPPKPGETGPVRRLHRDYISLGGLGLEGEVILGDRLYFPFNLTYNGETDPREATTAIMSVVDEHGVRHPNLAVPVSLVDIVQDMWIAPLRYTGTLWSITEPELLERHALQTLGLQRPGPRPLRPSVETAAPRGRRSE